MKFWEWDTEGYGYHILKAEGHEYNGSLDYFKTPAHLRGKPNSYDFQFEPKGELREIIRPNRESIKTLGEFLCQNDVAGHFAHHIDFQPLFASLKAILSHFC